jgi:hypothetical protein
VIYLIDAVGLNGRVDKLSHKFTLEVLQEKDSENENMLRDGSEHLPQGRTSWHQLLEPFSPQQQNPRHSLNWHMNCKMRMREYLFLANVCHESINFIPLFNQPSQDARCVYGVLDFSDLHECTRYLTENNLPRPPE